MEEPKKSYDNQMFRWRHLLVILQLSKNITLGKFRNFFLIMLQGQHQKYIFNFLEQNKDKIIADDWKCIQKKRWKKVTLGYHWNYETPIKEIICTDGVIDI